MKKNLSPPDTAVIVPAYNEGGHIADVVGRILDVQGDRAWDIWVVNDGSTDDTAQVLAQFGERIRVITHPANYGYGAALKSGIHATRAENIILIDADGQHDPSYIPEIVERLKKNEFVIGVRRNEEGVPFIRRPGKMVLKLVVGFLVGRRLTDVNYGFRGGRRNLYLRMLDILPDGFSFSTTSLVYVIKSRFAVSYMEIPTAARKGVSTVRIVQDGCNTLLLALRLIMLFDPMRAFAFPALFLILLGVVYQVYIVVTTKFSIVGGAILMILAGIILFHFGLLADQISSLRKEMSAQAGMLDEKLDRRDV